MQFYFVHKIIIIINNIGLKYLTDEVNQKAQELSIPEFVVVCFFLKKFFFDLLWNNNAKINKLNKWIKGRKRCKYPSTKEDSRCVQIWRWTN